MAAGAEPASAFGLGVSMTALQVSIGALNDIHDAPDDAGRKPGKPIPAGLLSVPAAWAVVGGGALVGVALGAVMDVRLGALAVVVLLIGYGYDLVAKGTAWSWLPFAVGIPLLPVYGWLGAAGALPSFFLALVPMAVLAGAALAIANARADLERDMAAGTVSVATRLGLEGSWRLHATLWLLTLVVGLAGSRSVEWDSSRSPWWPSPLASSGRPLPGRAIADRRVGSAPGSSRPSGARWPCWHGWPLPWGRGTEPFTAIGSGGVRANLTSQRPGSLWLVRGVETQGRTARPANGGPPIVHRITRHLRGLLVALATLALSAGVVLAARPASVEAPAAAAGDGLDRASEAAGKIVPVQPEAPAVPEADEDEDEEVADPTVGEGERPQNHGWFVSQAATGATPASADNHGAYVSEIARGDDGKPEAATVAAERGAAADAAKARKADKTAKGGIR